MPAESDHDRWQRQERRNHVPDNEVAGPVPLDAVLGRTSSLVVVLLAVRVFSTGIEFELLIQLRRVGEAPNSGLNHHRRGPVRADGVDDVWQLAVEYPDGRRAVAPFGGSNEDEETPALRMTDGSGNDTKLDRRFWLASLPGQGDVTVVFAWPYRGMAETRTVIAAETLRQARANILELWPYEPEPEPEWWPRA